MALGGSDKTRQLRWFDDDRGSISKLLLCANDIAANDCFTSLAHEPGLNFCDFLWFSTFFLQVPAIFYKFSVIF